MSLFRRLSRCLPILGITSGFGTVSGASRFVWILLATMSAGDIIWCDLRGIGISHWWPLAVVSAVLFGVAIVYRRGGLGPRIAAFAEWTLLWIVFSGAGALLTYLAAAGGGPLYDARMATADALLGFDWTAWYEFIASHKLLRAPLTIAYGSLVAQILFCVFVFSFTRRDERNAELLTNATLALLLTTVIFRLFPTLGPCVGVPEFRDAYLEDLAGLRNGTLPSLNIMVLKGVIAFPSFHAVLAVLFTHAHRGSPTFLPVAAFNAIMILSLPSEGGHYLVDVFGGIAVGLITVVATRAVSGRIPVLVPAA